MADPFRIRDHVSDFEDIVRDIIERSASTRVALPMLADIAYGSGPSETLDLFFPAERKPVMPVHMFIHGGYWRMFSKRDYSCLADTITAAGAIAVIVDYALMPSVRMAIVVDQVRRARDWVVGHIADHGGDPGGLTVSGHSAGAHLASFLFTRDQTPTHVRAALLLGGLYQLEPLRSSFLQAEIGLTDTEVASFTPMTHRHNSATRVSVLVGAEETQPFHDQAAAFVKHLQSHGLRTSLSVLDARNHMSSVRDLAFAETQAGQDLFALIRAAYDS